MSKKDEKAKGLKDNEVGQSEVDGVVMHPLPQAAIDVWDEYEAAIVARDEVLRSIFKWQYKKAVYFGRIAEQSRRKFWEMVKETYPELGDSLTYHKDKGMVSMSGKGA
jgi:hypothetical protein